MMDVLNFIFQDFWHWIGSVILIGAACSGFAAILRR